MSEMKSNETTEEIRGLNDARMVHFDECLADSHPMKILLWDARNSILRTGGRKTPIIARLLIDVMRAARPDLIDLHECLRCFRTSVRTIFYVRVQKWPI